MADKKFTEVKVGIFVLIAMVVVIATIFWTKGFLLNKDLESYTVYFKSVTNLKEGDPVTVKGVKMGTIENIELEGDSVKVNFSLDNSVILKEGYKVEVAMLELMGGKQIYIEPGHGPGIVDKEKPLLGSTGGDFNDIMRTVNDLSGDMRILMDKFGSNSDRLNQVLTNVNEIVGDPQMRMDMKSTLSNFETASRNINYLINENRSNLNSITTKVGRTVDNVNVLVDETSPEFKRTFAEIQDMTNRVDSLISNLNVMVLDVKEQRAGLGKFIYDDRFFNNLNTTLEEVERLTKQIRKDGVKINLF